MQNGKTACSRKSQVGDSLRKWWESYRKPVLYKFLGGVLLGLVGLGFPTTLGEGAPLEEFLWKGTIGELLPGGTLIELYLQNGLERK